MRITLYDGLDDTGHRRWLAEPVAAALSELEEAVLVLRPGGTGRDPDPRPSRREVPHARPRGALRPFVRELPAAHRSVVAAERAAREFATDVFVELEIDARAFAGHRPRRVGRFVAVLHGMEQLERDFGRERRLRPALHRARIGAFRRIFDAAEVVVCFRAEVAAAVRDVCPAADTAVLGYPVVAERDLDQGSDPVEGNDGCSAELRVLVPGDVRPDKGLATLVGALRGFETPTVVEIVGAQSLPIDPPGRIGPHRILFENRIVSELEMGAAHRRADVVLAPVPESFARTYRTRGTLLKAAAYGAPVLTTPDGLEQLPAGYGAVVYAHRSSESLAEALVDAADGRRELRRCADETGPASIRRHHTFEAFAAGLVAALRRDPPGSPG